MKNSINIECPGYLSYRTLPYVSEIFYHNQITYALPTGITPIEWENVLKFPEYCKKHSIALPQLFWEMPNQYFECAKEAIECSKILEPLGKRIFKCGFIYARDTRAVEEAEQKVVDNKELLNAFLISAADFNLLSREVLSHILYEVYLEVGMEGLETYILEKYSDIASFELFVAAVITNRMKIYSSDKIKVLVNDSSWYPYIEKYFENVGNGEIDEVEMLTYRLFENIINPLYGRCDTFEKSIKIEKIMEKESDAIQELKHKCSRIIQNCILYTNDKYDFRDNKLRELIFQEIIEPLSELLHKNKNDIKKIVTDFFLDSTVVGGILSMTQGADVGTLGVATAAGFMSAGLKYVISEKRNNIVEPTKILIEGIKKNHVKYLDYERMLTNISLGQLQVWD